jgi:large subunit ribosomal protein L24
MKKIQTWDKVIVTAGKWKGTTSTVLSIVEKKDERRGLRVVVKWVNVVKRAKRWEGFQEFEAPIHSSNIMLRDESSSAWSRVGIREDKKGKSERFYKKSGNTVTK